MADQDDNTANDNTNHDDPNNSESYPVISAAAASSSSDEELAKRWQTLEQLTSIFGFPMHVAEQAIDAVGYTDATTCYNYILDHNLAPDSGGPIAPIDHCPHVEQHVQLSEADVLHVLQGKRPQDAPCSHVGAIDTKLPATKSNNTIATPEQPKSATAGEEESSSAASSGCPATENWMCLHCGVVRCSRYQYGHATLHNEESHHCLAVSFSDLSVWCYSCQAYVKHPTKLGPILAQLERLKFAPILEMKSS